MSPRIATRHDQLLHGARTGDERAFRWLIERYRRELHAHCHRMLGSLDDADDALQETLLRAWRGLPGFDGPGTLRPWLYRIATNACLDALKKDRTRPLPTDYSDADGNEPAAPDDAVTSPVARYEQRERIELALVTALQHLPPRQRAVLILTDVLGYSARESAAVLGTTPTAVHSARQRARKIVDERLAYRGEQAMVRARRDRGLNAVVERYVRAIDQADISGLVAMLRDDAGPVPV